MLDANELASHVCCQSEASRLVRLGVLEGSYGRLSRSHTLRQVFCLRASSKVPGIELRVDWNAEETAATPEAEDLSSLTAGQGKPSVARTFPPCLYERQSGSDSRQG